MSCGILVIQRQRRSAPKRMRHAMRQLGSHLMAPVTHEGSAPLGSGSEISLGSNHVMTGAIHTCGPQGIHHLHCDLRICSHEAEPPGSEKTY
jgi:hypothetical protein